MLHYCETCKENSVVVKMYKSKKTNKITRVEFCINHNCKNRRRNG